MESKCCLVLLEYLAYADLKEYKILLSTAKDHEKMRRVVAISTDTTSLQQKLEEKDKVLWEKDKVIRELKRKSESESEEGVISFI